MPISQTSFVSVSVPALRLQPLGVLLLEQPKIKLLFFWTTIPAFPRIARAGSGGADVW